MSDETLDPNTPASPHPDAAKRHGDALIDGSGSRHGRPPEESALSDESAPENDES